MNSAFRDFVDASRTHSNLMLIRIFLPMLSLGASVAHARAGGDCHSADWLSKPTSSFKEPELFINCNHGRFEDEEPSIPTCQQHCGKMANSPVLGAYCERIKGMSPWVAPVVDTNNQRVCDCPCSCVVTGTLILTPSGEFPVETFRKGDIVSLPLTAAGEGLVQAALSSPVKNHPVRRLRTDATEILVSPNHLFVSSLGMVVAAEKLSPGMTILNAERVGVRIESNDAVDRYTGALHNFILDRGSRNRSRHVYVSNGLLSGDLELQNANDRMEFSLKRRLGQIPVILNGQIVGPGKGLKPK